MPIPGYLLKQQHRTQAAHDLWDIINAIKDGKISWTAAPRTATKRGKKVWKLVQIIYVRCMNAEHRLKIEREERKKEVDELRNLCEKLTQDVELLSRKKESNT